MRNEGKINLRKSKQYKGNWSKINSKLSKEISWQFKGVRNVGPGEIANDDATK